MNSKAVSQIISVIILIVLSLGAISIIIGFVIPYIKDRLEGTKCAETIGKIEIVSGDYTCYENGELQIQVQIQNINELLKGFRVRAGEENFLIPEDVNMLNGNAEIPPDNSARTYIYKMDKKPEKIEIYAVLKNKKTCEIADEVNYVPEC